MVENNTDINIENNEHKNEVNIETNVETNTEVNENKEIGDEKDKNQPEGEPISGLVNQELVKTLMEMGYSKTVSEKSLFLNQQNVDKALEWIYENQEQPDFEEELRLMGKQE